MYRHFFNELNTKMYPSTLLHAFGVNGKVSGSVGAAGEMSGGVLVLLHGPRGCGYHYRFSARRRHQPFYDMVCSDLTEAEVVYGGIDKLVSTARAAWRRYKPALILIVPTPVSDILNEDIGAAAKALQGEGIKVAAVQPELFSHRDKSYARNHARELAKRKITGDNRLEMELKGCGFTEALYALVEQVMEPHKMAPRSVNIETVGWGGGGVEALHEIEAFFKQCGISVNCWIPSAPLDAIIAAPRAQLNIVKRVRWARRMKERFGTEYLHISAAGRYTGLSGIATFYRDVGEKLGILEEIEPIIARETDKMRAYTAKAREEIAQYRCVLICRGLQGAPFRIKLYAEEFGVRLSHICVFLTEDMRRSVDMTCELEAQLMSRVREAAALYAKDAEILLNPDDALVREVFSTASAVVGTSDFTLDGKGAPVVADNIEATSLSFPSYARSVFRLRDRLQTCVEHKELILNRMPFDAEDYPLYNNRESKAAKEMWRRMWLHKEGEKK